MQHISSKFYVNKNKHLNVCVRFQGGGIEILSDILSDRSNPEPQMREAITVLTQITAPWLRGHYDLTQLHLYLNNIIEHITG